MRIYYFSKCPSLFFITALNLCYIAINGMQHILGYFSQTLCSYLVKKFDSSKFPFFFLLELVFSG